jgi:DNA-directed RNA polymerase specialized sigma24 family protein
MCNSSGDAGPEAVVGHLQASLRELRLLHPDEPEDTRRAAFESMVHRPSGWWGSGTLTSFALASSRGEAARVLGGAGGGLDTIDWEGIALQALLTLYDEGYRVTRSPRGWLRAVIRHLVCQSVRRESFHLAHARIDHLPGVNFSSTSSVDHRRSPYAAMEAKTMEGALADLPPALQSVAKLYVCDRLGRSEVRRALGISDTVLRGRLLRLRSRLAQMLSNQLVSGGRPKAIRSAGRP